MTTRRWLIIILLVSVMLRIGTSFYLGDEISEIRGGTYDQISYDRLATRVVAGEGFSFDEDWWPRAMANEPTAFWSFLYTSFLALIYQLFGHSPLLARIIQAIIVGLLMPWMVYRIGERSFNKSVGIIAALITALYAYFILYAATLMTEALYITGILWVLDITMRYSEQISESNIPWHNRRWGLVWMAFQLGLAIGVTLLLRQVAIFLVFTISAWMLWLGWILKRLRVMIKFLAGAAFVTFILLLPWVVRNYNEFGRIGMPNTNAGFTLFWSNHPVYGTQFTPTLDPSDGPSYRQLIPNELASLNETELDQALLKRAVQFILDEPMRFFQLSLSRVPVYFLFWPTPDATFLSNISRVLSFGITLPFIIIGLALAIRMVVSTTRSWIDLKDPLQMIQIEGKTDLHLAYQILLIFLVLTYTFVHIISWANVRYRLPVDAILIIFAASAINAIYRRFIMVKVASGQN